MLRATNLSGEGALRDDARLWQVDWGHADTDTIRQVSRDGQRIMLTQDQNVGSPGCVIGLETDRLSDELISKGARKRSEDPRTSPGRMNFLTQILTATLLAKGTHPREDVGCQ